MNAKAICQVAGSLVVLAVLAACSDRVDLDGASELVYIGDGIYMVECKQSGRLLAPSGRGDVASVKSLARVQNSDLIVAEAEAIHVSQASFYLLDNCVQPAQFSTMGDLNVALSLRGLAPVDGSDFVAVGVVRRRGAL